MMVYSSMFKCKRISSFELQNEVILNKLIEEGYLWIKRYNVTQFHNITRNPTIGCTVELYTTRSVGTIPIDSVKGKKLINKLCYF